MASSKFRGGLELLPPASPSVRAFPPIFFGFSKKLQFFRGAHHFLGVVQYSPLGHTAKSWEEALTSGTIRTSRTTGEILHLVTLRICEQSCRTGALSSGAIAVRVVQLV